MPRAFITGVSGFAGPYLAACLRHRGFDVAGLSSGAKKREHPISLQGVRVHKLDIRDRVGLRTVLDAEKPDFVFHLAALSHVPTSLDHPDATFDVNVTGTLNLLEAVRLINKIARVVFVSSGNVYGHVDSGETGFTEISPVCSTSPYACSKIMGEQLVRSYVEDFGLQIVIARPFNHTGAGQSASFAVSGFALQIAAGVLKGGPVHLQTGRLDPRRDISDVRDVVRAYALLGERGIPGQIYNVCSGTMRQMSEVVATLADLARIPVTAELDPSTIREREIMRSGGDFAKIRDELGWAPTIPFRTTAKELLEYWVERCSASSGH